MCGIVGYIGSKNATPVILDGLKRLEYRGYDSAGIAVTNGDVTILRAVGKLCNLEDLVAKSPPVGRIGIGHTRWATHGRPSEENAHPHRAENIILVHNGIIENYAELREELEKAGHEFTSQTDTEVICHLIYQLTKQGMPIEKAISDAPKKVNGSYALVVMDARNKNTLYVARHGSPLVIGIGKGEMMVASDIPAILPYTRNVIILEDGDIGKVTKDGYELSDITGSSVVRDVKYITWDPVAAEKGGFKHFMLKEIFEQPRILEDALSGRINPRSKEVTLKELDVLGGNGDFHYNRVYIIACGTSYHAGLVGKYWMERMCRLPIHVEYASEFRYREPVLDEHSIVIPISQSGETADTLAALRIAKSKGSKIISICNVVDSSIARESDVAVYTHAGPEIGVASTKAFTAQLVVLLLMSITLGQKAGMVTKKDVSDIVSEMMLLPRKMEELLGCAAHVKTIADKYAFASEVLFIARGMTYPVALEGALKLKEISYVHAEGFAAGELKHGPIALIDDGVPVIALLPKDHTYDKVLSNVEECRARGADVVALVSEEDAGLRQKVKWVVKIPNSNPYIAPILYALPLQLFAYYMAIHKGTDVDRPRNLAKSVTVE